MGAPRPEAYLQLGEVLGLLVDVHATQTDANGTRRDNDDAVARLLQLDGRVDNEGEDWQEGLMGFFVDNGARAWAVSMAGGRRSSV